MYRFWMTVCFALGLGVAPRISAQEGTPLFSPSLYLYGVYGTSSADHPGDFAAGGHDPNRKDAPQLQSLEPSVSMRWGHLEGFATGLAYTDMNDDLEWEWEEYFLKLKDLPGGLELRGGRLLSRVGFHNPTHLHSWNTVDAPLAHSLFLGDDGLALEGGDLSIYMDTEHPTVLTLGVGRRPSHDHDHGHGEDDHDDHAEDHDDHADEHEEGHDDHDHSGFGLYEAFRVKEDVFTIGLRRDHLFNDFHVLGLTAFGGMGENEEGGDAWFAGAGAEYRWRENGIEPGGRALTWRTTVMRFSGDSAYAEHDDHGGEHAEEDHDHEEEHAGHEDDHDDHEESHDHGDKLSTWGLNTELVYEMTDNLHPFARIDYVAAADGLELPEWIRYSAGVTLPFGDYPGATVRLQANADERGDESEQSVWLQVGFRLGGGAEVR